MKTSVLCLSLAMLLGANVAQAQPPFVRISPLGPGRIVEIGVPAPWLPAVDPLMIDGPVHGRLLLMPEQWRFDFLAVNGRRYAYVAMDRVGDMWFAAKEIPDEVFTGKEDHLEGWMEQRRGCGCYRFTTDKGTVFDSRKGKMTVTGTFLPTPKPAKPGPLPDPGKKEK